MFIEEKANELCCLSFKNQERMIKFCQNIQQEKTPGLLSCQTQLLLSSLIFICFLGFSKSTLAQNNLKIGDWKHHFAFNDCFHVIETPTDIIGSTSLGLNIYSKASQALTSLTKLNGLSDYDLTAISYLPEKQTIAIGYANGNIDLVISGAVFNINDLKIKQIDGSKKINHFLSLGNTLYCSTDFGIILINIDKKEIASTWYIGNEASNLRIFQLCLNGNDLYAATDKGLRKTSLTSSNPALFENWQVISPTTDPYNSVVWFSDQLIAALGLKGQTNTLQSFSNNGVVAFYSIASFQNLNTHNDELIVVATNALRFFNSSNQLVQTISAPRINDVAFTPSFRFALKDMTDNFWVADNTQGLIKWDGLNNFSVFLIQGPKTNQCHQLLYAGNNLWMVAGGLTSAWNNANIKATTSVLKPTGWQYITWENTPELAFTRDLIGLTAHPRNPDNVFINSWGEGVFEFELQDGSFVLKNNFNKSENGLQNIDIAAPSGYVRIGATAFDKNNTLFMTNSSVANGIVAYFPEDQSFLRLSYQSVRNTHYLGTLLMPSAGDKWMIIPRGAEKGLFVWNDNNTPKNQADDKYRSAIPPSQETDNRNAGQLLLWDDKGEEITRNIFSIAEDQNGYIWIGTDVGVVVQYQPRTIFTREKPIFSRIKIARQDGSGLADYLLENETVTTIAVDAGNRKWIGTRGSGVFLVSADGTKTISAFNTQNSQLPSDFISSIVINNQTGEVFIGTEKGVVSTRGSATQGMNSFKEIYAFPNPVRPEFSGTITITGLMTKSNVKITDVSGKLVYETTSVGGQAFWDGTNLWGEKVKSGVYIIFVASEDGSESGVTKIAIIR